MFRVPAFVFRFQGASAEVFRERALKLAASAATAFVEKPHSGSERRNRIRAQGASVETTFVFRLRASGLRRWGLRFRNERLRIQGSGLDS